MSEEDHIVTIQPHNFPPSELSIIAPDLAIQKYLEAGYRPSLRKFQEFKPISITDGELSRYDVEDGEPNSNSKVLGSSIVKSNNIVVHTYISAQLIEDSFEAINDYRTKLDSDLITSNGDDENDVEGALNYKNGVVYPVVQIGGLMGPPSSLEIDLGEQLYNAILTSGVIPRSSLKVPIGLKITDDEGNTEIVQRGKDAVSDELLAGLTDKSFSYVLTARIIVGHQEKQTTPLYDICHVGLLKALRNTKLPHVYLTEREALMRRKGGKAVSDQAIEGYDLVCDNKAASELVVDESRLSCSSTFGVLDVDMRGAEHDDDDVDMDAEAHSHPKASALLADLEGDIESSIAKRIQVTTNSEGKIYGLRVQKAGGEFSNAITKQLIEQAIDMAQNRSRILVKEL